MRISNSKLDLYTACPTKYKFKYVENLKGNYTSTALLFGVGIDLALNYILESMRDKKDWQIENAYEIFINHMNTWNGENRLDFFKGDVPGYLLDTLDEDDPKQQEEIWGFLCERGCTMIDTYVREILTQIEEVISVQDSGSIKNEEGDEFVFVVDFIAKMKDGRTVLLDNKTSSKRYPKNKVEKSQQLSLYLEAYPHIKYAGYLVLIKNPDKERGVTHQIMIGEIPQSTTDDSFDRLEATLKAIKSESFEPNTKSCRLYGKPCEYYNYCMFQDATGLVPAYDKKKDKK